MTAPAWIVPALAVAAAWSAWLTARPRNRGRRNRGGGTQVSRHVRAADGDLVLKLGETDRARFAAPRGSVPVAGTTVTLWRLPGTWHVWSPGPAVGTWWVRAADDTARAIVTKVTAKSDRGAPVIGQVWKDCIAVRSGEIRPAAIGGAR